MAYRVLLLGLCLSTSVSCKEVPVECTQLEPELNLELGFARYELEGKSVDQWREDLSEALLEALGYDEWTVRNAPFLIGQSVIDDIEVNEYEIISDADGVLIPFSAFTPRRALRLGKHHVVLALHGHGETAEAVFDKDSEMNDVGGALLERGYTVITIEMRSFGTFVIDGKGHDAYAAGLDTGEFIGLVVGDSVQVAQSVVELFAEVGLDSFTVLGHSVGGYAALHIGVYAPVTRAISSSHFSPYGCMNTDFHDACQDVLGAEGRFEIYDTVGLISPRPVDIFYNTGDSFYTRAADEGFERLKAIYEKTGAPGAATFTVTPGLGHEIPIEAVLERLPPIDEL